ncbi:MAG: class I SAM-dependent methyltransferase [Verrucomicrobia bacterium]|nr:class I SAM-dependent methyltransferase [Verrucomicrobiota bacterium]
MKHISKIQVVPTQEQARKYWDRWNAECRGNICEDSATAHLGFAVLQETRKLQLDNIDILEVGCGTGWLAAQIRPRRSYVGLDLSPAALEAAKRRVPEAHFEVADFLTWQPYGQTFDLAIIVDAIAYFQDQSSALKKMASLLRPGGRLILTSVNPTVYSRMRSVGPPAAGQIRNWLSAAKLKSLLIGAGFNVLSFYSILPEGDLGFLRWINSRKLNSAASVLVPKRVLERFKECLGLGQYFVAVARRS